MDSLFLASGPSIDSWHLCGIDSHTILDLVWQLVRLIQERMGQLARSERRINRDTYTYNCTLQALLAFHCSSWYKHMSLMYMCTYSPWEVEGDSLRATFLPTSSHSYLVLGMLECVHMEGVLMTNYLRGSVSVGFSPSLVQLLPHTWLEAS